MTWTFWLVAGSLSIVQASFAGPLKTAQWKSPASVFLANSPGQSARQFLKDSAAELNLTGDLSDLKLESVSESALGYHVRFSQSKAGIPVDRAGVVVTLGHHHEVLSYVNDYAVSAESAKIPPRFDLPRERVMALVYDALKLTASPKRELIEQKVLVIDGQPHAVYVVSLSAPVDHKWSWEIVVDASSGQIRRSETMAYDAREDTRADDPSTVKVAALALDPNPTIKTKQAYASSSDYQDANNANNAFFDSMMTPVQIDTTYDDGTYSLTNSYVTITDQELPANPDCTNTTGNFALNRGDPCFDAVNAVYFITKSLTYLNETLGIKAAPIRYSGPLHVDPHGLDGDDNSHYDRSTDELAYGEGGVDDAQDHDVLLHELGHAIHNWVTHGHMSQVQGLSEGIGDYWASSYSRSFMKPGDVAYNWTYSYDGHNEFWDGRIVNSAGKYPDAAKGELHDAGQLWASTCIEIWDAIGKAKMDKIFWSGISMLSDRSSQADAASALLVAAQNLYPNEPDTIAAVRQKLIDRGYPIP